MNEVNRKPAYTVAELASTRQPVSTRKLADHHGARGRGWAQPFAMCGVGRGRSAADWPLNHVFNQLPLYYAVGQIMAFLASLPQGDVDMHNSLTAPCRAEIPPFVPCEHHTSDGLYADAVYTLPAALSRSHAIISVCTDLRATGPPPRATPPRPPRYRPRRPLRAWRRAWRRAC